MHEINIDHHFLGKIPIEPEPRETTIIVNTTPTTQSTSIYSSANTVVTRSETQQTPTATTTTTHGESRWTPTSHPLNYELYILQSQNIMQYM